MSQVTSSLTAIAPTEPKQGSLCVGGSATIGSYHKAEGAKSYGNSLGNAGDAGHFAPDASQNTYQYVANGNVNSNMVPGLYPQQQSYPFIQPYPEGQPQMMMSRAASSGMVTAGGPNPPQGLVMPPKAQAFGWPSVDETQLLLSLQFQQQQRPYLYPGAMTMMSMSMQPGTGSNTGMPAVSGNWNSVGSGTTARASTGMPFAALGVSKMEPFPEKLHRLLREVEAQGQSNIISWVNNGEAFEIHQSDRFFQEIVPHYFKQSRLSSFKRQLGLYGFQLNAASAGKGGTTTTGHGYYSHPCFRKDSPDLCRKMRRTGLSSAKAKKEVEDTIPTTTDVPQTKTEATPIEPLMSSADVV